MSKTTRLYQDTRTASAAGSSHLDKLNDELQDVTRIMTKNMEELLWRGDSLDRTCCSPNTFLWILAYERLRLSARHVAPFDLATVRVGEVPSRGEEYQHPSDDSAVRTHWSHCLDPHYLHLLAILMRSVFLLTGLGVHCIYDV